MNRKRILNKFKHKKGQINIAEVVVSATIILVLSFSVAQLGTNFAETNESNPIEKLKDRAQNALNIGISSGILRELAYSNDTDSTPAQNQMKTLIDGSLPLSAQYSLLQKTLDNSDHYLSNRILLGIIPIPSGNLNIFTVSVLISGNFDSTQIIDVPFIITLIVVLGDF